MNVQLGEDGHPGSDRLAHGLENMAVGVVDSLGHHGPVQFKQHSVDGAGGGDSLDQLAQHRVEDIPRGGTAGMGLGEDGGNEFEAVGIGALDESSHGRVRMAELLEDFRPFQVAEVFPVAGPGGGNQGKCAALVTDRPGDNPHTFYHLVAFFPFCAILMDQIFVGSRSDPSRFLPEALE